MSKGIFSGLISVLLALLVAGCDNSGAGGTNTSAPAEVRVGLGKVSAATQNAVTDDGGELASVTSIILSVSAPNMTTVTTSLPLNGDTVTLSIPAGSNRVFMASAYNVNVLTHTGSTTVTQLIGGTSTRVAMTLNAVVPDTTAPSVSTTTPIHLTTGVSTGTTVSVVFDEAMNPATLSSSSFVLRHLDPFGTGGSFTFPTGTVSYNSSTFTATFTPTTALPQNTAITAILTLAITDVASNPLASTPYSFSFQTAAVVDSTPPTVDSTVPAASAINVAISSVVDVTFSEGLSVLSINTSSFQLSYGVSTLITGTVSYNASTFVATFTPDANLPAGTLITATLDNTIIDLAGNPLAATPYVMQFTTAGAAILDPIEIVSVASDGTQGNQISESPDMSGDGRYVVFVSDANNLVAGDTNSVADIFVRDVQTSTTSRVSIASDTTQSNGDSQNAFISADGRYVAFSSDASNLVAGDTNGDWDVFMHDRQTGATTRVSLENGGGQSPIGGFAVDISADGRYVVFASNSTTLVASPPQDVFRNLFRHDRQTGATVQVDVANDGSHPNFVEQYGAYTGTFASMSADGRYVAFAAVSSNLVSGDTNGGLDVFVRDVQASTTIRVNVANDGSQANGGSTAVSITPDGRYVAFSSYADNLVAGDTNVQPDIMVRDLVAGTTVRASLANDGSEATGACNNPSISADGRYVAFESYASNLVSVDTNGVPDVFVRDVIGNATTLVSVAGNMDSTQGEYASVLPIISSDGRYVAFYSVATTLVAGDVNGRPDVFRGPVQ